MESEDRLFDLPLSLSLSRCSFFLLALLRSQFKANPKNPASPVSVWVCLISVTHTCCIHTLNTCLHIHQLKGTPLRSTHPLTNLQRPTHSALFIKNSKHRYCIIHSLLCHYIRLSICLSPILLLCSHVFCLSFFLVLSVFQPQQTLHHLTSFLLHIIASSQCG